MQALLLRGAADQLLDTGLQGAPMGAADELRELRSIETGIRFGLGGKCCEGENHKRHKARPKVGGH